MSKSPMSSSLLMRHTISRPIICSFRLAFSLKRFSRVSFDLKRFRIDVALAYGDEDLTFFNRFSLDDLEVLDAATNVDVTRLDLILSALIQIVFIL